MKDHIKTYWPLYLAGIVTAFIGWAATSPARGHDSWISSGGHRNNATGEWCCGEGDCFVIPPALVRYGKGNNGQFYYIIYWPGQTPDLEAVPESEAQPSADGQYWRCKRPDGSRRCFFAPPPGS